jgi:hypothetical protein
MPPMISSIIQQREDGRATLPIFPANAQFDAA